MNSITSTFPQLVFLAGPWLFLGLVLSGPFLVLLTVVIAALAAPALAVIVAVTPYLLLQRYRARQVPVAPPHVTFELRRVVA